MNYQLLLNCNKVHKAGLHFGVVGEIEIRIPHGRLHMHVYKRSIIKDYCIPPLKHLFHDLAQCQNKPGIF
jgi:hypothetical protein